MDQVEAFAGQLIAQIRELRTMVTTYQTAIIDMLENVVVAESNDEISPVSDAWIDGMTVVLEVQGRVLLLLAASEELMDDAQFSTLYDTARADYWAQINDHSHLIEKLNSQSDLYGKLAEIQMYEKSIQFFNTLYIDKIREKGLIPTRRSMDYRVALQVLKGVRCHLMWDIGILLSSLKNLMTNPAIGYLPKEKKQEYRQKHDSYKALLSSIESDDDAK